MAKKTKYTTDYDELQKEADAQYDAGFNDALAQINREDEDAKAAMTAPVQTTAQTPVAAVRQIAGKQNAEQQRYGLVSRKPVLPNSRSLDGTRIMTPEELEATDSPDEIAAKDAESEARQNAMLNANAKPVLPGAGTDTGTGTDAEQRNWQNYLFNKYDEQLNDENKSYEGNEKQAKARMRIANTAQAIGAIANLWGVAKGGYNQKIPETNHNIYNQMIKDKALHDRNVQSIMSNLNKAYNTVVNARNRQTSLDQAQQRIEIARDRENRLAQKVSDSNELQWIKTNLAVEKFYADKERDDRNWKFKTEKEKADEAYRWAHQNYLESRERRLAQQAADNAASREIATQVSDMANDWGSTSASMFQTLFGSPNPPISTIPDELKQDYNDIKFAKGNARKTIIKRFAEEHPEWAAKNNLGGNSASSGTESAPSSTSPSAPKSSGTASSGTQKKANPMGGTKKPNPMGSTKKANPMA